MNYGIKEHSKGLIKILERENTHMLCPQPPQRGGIKLAKGCYICRKFIGYDGTTGCPCRVFSPEEAIKRSWIALEDGGHLE